MAPSRACAPRCSRPREFRRPTDERVTSILVSAAQREFAALPGTLAHETTTLPSAWRAGGLSVVIDQLLERAAPLGECPLEGHAMAGPELAAFVVVPTQELQLVVTDGKGVVVHRTAIGLGASRSRVALPLAARCAKDSRFTVTVKHPSIAEASVSLEALSDPRGWVELQPAPVPAQEALDYLWSSLRETDDLEGFQVPRLAPPPAPTRPPRQSRYEHYVDDGSKTFAERVDSALYGCLILGPLSALVALPLSALCWFDVLPWHSLLWLFGGAVALSLLVGISGFRPPEESE